MGSPLAPRIAELGVVHVTEEWLGGLRSAMRSRLGEGQDFCYVNLGDSIATGRIGISSKDEHYAAVAARAAAAQLTVPSTRALHTADDLSSDGRMAAIGPRWRTEDGGLYGGGSYTIDAGRDGVLHHDRQPRCRTVRIGFRGRFRYSVDGGASWSSQQARSGDGVGRAEIAVAGDGLMLRSDARDGCRIYWLQSAGPHEPGIAWYTSGIGATRVHDLHRILSADGEAGYRAYGAVAPDLVTLEIGVNDTIHADVETVRGSRTALRAVISRLRHHGVANIALVGPVPVRADFQPGPWRVGDAYREIFRPTAVDAGIPLLDITVRWGDYDSAYEAGHLADQVHPTPAGHADVGAMVAAILLA